MSELKEFFTQNPGIEKVYYTKGGDYYLNAYDHEDGKKYAHKRFLHDPINNVQEDAEITKVVTREEGLAEAAAQPAAQEQISKNDSATESQE
jgi:hypothetical protein